jgi:hypothetical protein
LESAQYFLAESLTTFYNLHIHSFYVMYYVYLMYIYLLVYSLGQLTQFSYAVVDALSTAILPMIILDLMDKDTKKDVCEFVP